MPLGCFSSSELESLRLFLRRLGLFRRPLPRLELLGLGRFRAFPLSLLSDFRLFRFFCLVELELEDLFLSGA